MNILVVDACVVIKWFIPEIHSDAALRIQNTNQHALHVPDFLRLEIGNILCKKTTTDRIDPSGK